jgi:hypothetical protein
MIFSVQSRAISKKRDRWSPNRKAASPRLKATGVDTALAELTLRALEANLKRFQNHADGSERKEQNPPEPSRVTGERRSGACVHDGVAHYDVVSSSANEEMRAVGGPCAAGSLEDPHARSPPVWHESATDNRRLKIGKKFLAHVEHVSLRSSNPRILS